MKEFEYKVLQIKRGTFTSAAKYASEFESELNALGIKGWELVEVSGDITLDSYALILFKRELIR